MPQLTSKRRDRQPSPEQAAAVDFVRDTARHVLTIKLDQGVYRHITLAQPDSGICRFDLVTFPGRLVYTGDMGTYVFARIHDMFEFFRSPDAANLRINPSYWAQKCEAAEKHGGVEEFDPRLFRWAVITELREYRNRSEQPLAILKEIRQEVIDDVLSCAEDGHHEAVKAARDFHCSGFQMDDFTEYTLTKHTHRFVWCCHAIVWGIAQYDKAITQTPEASCPSNATS